MKIALIGYGKMGHIIEQIALARGHQIVSIIDKDNIDDFDNPEFASADVAIEFSTPSTAVDNYLRSFAAGVPVVSGTTGWLQHSETIKSLCRQGKGTLFYSSNFSIGVNVFMAVNRYLAKLMNEFNQYEPTMHEVHHIHKLDHPSGTALTLAEDILSNIDRKDSWCEPDTDMITDKNLVISHSREGEVPGIHTINWESDVDSISITHSAKSRAGFALVAVMAAEWLIGRKGFFSMNDMLKF